MKAKSACLACVWATDNGGILFCPYSICPCRADDEQREPVLENADDDITV